MKKVDVHRVLINSLEKIPDKDVAVFLSSGIDSRSLVYALEELGKTPHIYSFVLQGRQSRDFAYAKHVAKQERLEFTPIILPVSIDSLISDTYFLHDALNCVKKTEYICTWPFIYAYKKVTEHYITDGIGADTHFVLSKKGILHYKNNVDAFRRAYWSQPNYGQKNQHAILEKMHSKVGVRPYMEKEMRDMFYGTTWDEVNKPRQKQPILDAFPDKFKNGKVWPHTNLQLGDSGISKHFDLLLKTDMNKKGYKSVVGVFNEVNRGIRI